MRPTTRFGFGVRLSLPPSLAFPRLQTLVGLSGRCFHILARAVSLYIPLSGPLLSSSFVLARRETFAQLSRSTFLPSPPQILGRPFTKPNSSFCRKQSASFRYMSYGRVNEDEKPCVNDSEKRKTSLNSHSLTLRLSERKEPQLRLLYARLGPLRTDKPPRAFIVPCRAKTTEGKLSSEVLKTSRD